MQRYNKNSKLMFNMRFYMFKMREFTDFRPKFTQFAHFNPKKGIFLRKKMAVSRKLSIFAHE